MCLKNNLCSLIFFITIFFLFSNKVFAETGDKERVLQHLNKLKYFSASFLQNDGEQLSEGKVYVGENRVRAEYFHPSKILIVLDEDKAMYYNYDLDEDEFFNPKNTNAWFFYDIFRNPLFFEDGLIEIANNELILEKNGFDREEKSFLIKVYFEKNPLILRSIEVVINEEILRLSIYNHSYDEEFDKNLFKLINPKFLN